MSFSKTRVALWCALPFILVSASQVQARTNVIENEAALQAAVNQQVSQLMQQQQIPGMAVAVLWQGKTYHYSFGQADLAKKTAVTPDTLFELGSISKTYAGVLGAMAIESGAIALTDPVAKHWPALTSPQWQQIQMQHLATYTAGGLPLFMPDSVTDKASLQNYYQQWQPQYAAGTQRVYANTSIGLFAHLAVAADGKSYADAFDGLKKDLQLQQTFLQVPTASAAQYAWGYNEGKPVRIGTGVLLDEAGGAKASVRDVASWVQANLQPEKVTAPVLKAGIARAQQRYAKAGQMYQGLGWEMLDYPLPLSALTAMTDPDFVKGSAATLISPPTAAVTSSWVHKTGATGGFGAYAAFIPSRQVGIVMLSNKRYPNAQRVELAYRILEGLK
ncbi:beta-lactamase [Rheinheimera riviphila]|uniref:Beta-lactamase n=1 Tax=Rheinheimera riviphila TaxID=1834037 RepID=A0A437QIN4_9GAMM|nr:class C beta-lactamase [Rheinheimera riviphila]RVU34407.1 beta-lactamase [Rheinheimera riviphila]